MAGQVVTVRELLAALDGLDPDATVELSVWSGDGPTWIQVEAERVTPQTVHAHDAAPRSVVQIWTPATSPQYGGRS